ncbi:hypothetical protein MTR67_021281 [Solanum verrucosum]|uniref:Uncharacterized protein n=1 Tax=Solanum verrucosum TaxID=315347 RepID=A0AAF0QWL1_SOLVR|nr:hypothetical protein MTR67_021281 [Solanum verrucosum]
MRLFLERIHPIDKKLQYQIQKLTRDSDTVSEKSVISEKGIDTQKEDLLKYRPKPNMLVRKTSNTAEVGFWMVLMYIDPPICTCFYGRGEDVEVREVVGSESRELRNYMAKMEKRAKREEEVFDRAPLTKLEKKKMKHLKKSRNGEGMDMTAGVSTSISINLEALRLEWGNPLFLDGLSIYFQDEHQFWASTVV